jgi:flagellar basal body rod protein FlgG
MTDMILLKQEHFLCENKDVDIWMYQINGKAFFNATKVWKNFGSPDTLSLDIYLRTDPARKMMLKMYSNLKGFDKLFNEINTLTQNLSTKGFKSKASDLSESTEKTEVNEFEYVREFLTLTHMIRLKQFNPEFEDGFIHATKGKYGSTFLCYNLFLDYCTHLSTQLKIQVFETFEKFGDLTKLEGQDLIDALQKKLDDAIAKLPTHTSQVVSPLIRNKVKGKTKDLHEAIQNVYYLDSQLNTQGNMYAYIHDQINAKLFGATSAKMHQAIELRKTSKVKLRDCMTDKAISLLEQVESAVFVYLNDCITDDFVPSLDDLDSVIIDAANGALFNARRRKDNFLILQNAIEREYDLLVKNADCVKDVGVVPRPDEICEKNHLIPMTTAPKNLAVTEKESKTKQRTTPKQLVTKEQKLLLDQSISSEENLQMSFLSMLG